MFCLSVQQNWLSVFKDRVVCVVCVCFLVSLSVWKKFLTLFYGLLDRVGSEVETNGKVAPNLTL